MNLAKLKTKKLLSFIGLSISLLSLSQISWSGGYTIDWDNLNNGIQPESSDVYSVMSSVGQSVTGMMKGDNYILVGGFWTGYYQSGDVNCDGKVEVGDVIYFINYLYRSGPSPCFWESGDVNCDRVIDIGDVVYVINYLFHGGLPPKHCDP